MLPASYCAKLGMVEEVVSFAAMRDYLVALANYAYQNPASRRHTEDTRQSLKMPLDPSPSLTTHPRSLRKSRQNPRFPHSLPSGVPFPPRPAPAGLGCYRSSPFTAIPLILGVSHWRIVASAPNNRSPAPKKQPLKDPPSNDNPDTTQTRIVHGSHTRDDVHLSMDIRDTFNVAKQPAPFSSTVPFRVTDLCGIARA